MKLRLLPASSRPIPTTILMLSPSPARRARFTYPIFRFMNPIAGVRIGLIEGRYIVNPTYDEVRESRLNLIVAGTEEAIVMVEAGATEVSEEIMVEALMLAHKEINRLCRWQKELYKALEIQKREVAAAGTQ